jgi:2-methylisocitrate lyase-like PEP mutase family enzyme
MKSNFEKFKELHSQKELLLLPNAWDARSAIMLQECKYPAIATSSAAVANSLGYDDGEKMSFVDYLFVIRRILSSIKIPLTVDIETGYGENDEEIAANVCRLAELGVAGINIEDSTISGDGRSLKDPALFAKTIDRIKTILRSNNLDLFINLRCDTHILNVPDKQKETIRRIGIYNESLADGIFIPCIVDEKEIAEAVSASRLPVNVMCIPNLSAWDALNALGVKRVSMGPFMFQKVYAGINKVAKDITSTRTFAPLFS